MAININKSLGDFHLLICPKPGPYQDELPAKALDNRLAYQAVLGHQANLRESSKSKELAELRLQVLVVVIASDACEYKKEIMRLRE